MNLVTNQAAKAQRFADFLNERVGHALDVDQVALWADVEWQTVTDWLNELRGTTETMPRSCRGAIVALLRAQR